jgi:hypothetical protein
MSTYSWRLPSPPGSGGTPSSSSPSSATPASRLGGLLDQEIDPATLDFIDTDDGEWSETADSRSIVMIMIDTHLGKSYSAPGDGTRIAELLEAGEPVSTSVVVADVSRAMRILEADGVISGFSMRATDDDGDELLDQKTGRFSPELRYTDLATGSPVDLVLSPQG